MKEKWKDRSYLLDPYEENNIFPNSFIVTLTDLELNAKVQEEIAQAKLALEILGGNVAEIFEYELTLQENFQRNLGERAQFQWMAKKKKKGILYN